MLPIKLKPPSLSAMLCSFVSSSLMSGLMINLGLLFREEFLSSFSSLF